MTNSQIWNIDTLESKPVSLKTFVLKSEPSWQRGLLSQSIACDSVTQIRLAEFWGDCTNGPNLKPNPSFTRSHGEGNALNTLQALKIQHHRISATPSITSHYRQSKKSFCVVPIWIFLCAGYSTPTESQPVFTAYLTDSMDFTYGESITMLTPQHYKQAVDQVPL